MSDHGFHSFRQSVNLNTWLVQEGYMTLQGQAPGEKKLADLFGGGGQFWENVDWSRTKAYAMGLGQIYLNLEGRESRGIVAPGADARAVQDAIADRLLTLTDPHTHARIVDAVYKRDDTYSGPFLDNAAELQVGLADGYRVSWQTTLGGSPPGLVYPNMKKWSGDHGAFDYKSIAGVLITNRPIQSQRPRIIDLAPTVLKYFELRIPSEIDGRALF
jgi:predicted AlkP superfamily phosphohydrolase/phosphomutase